MLGAVFGFLDQPVGVCNVFAVDAVVGFAAIASVEVRFNFVTAPFACGLALVNHARFEQSLLRPNLVVDD